MKKISQNLLAVFSATWGLQPYTFLEEIDNANQLLLAMVYSIGSDWALNSASKNPTIDDSYIRDTNTNTQI